MDQTVELARTIERLHNCKAAHLSSEIVCQVCCGKTVWDGLVEVFAISGHPQADRCYAWTEWEDHKGRHKRTAVVLGVWPVDSPAAAITDALMDSGIDWETYSVENRNQ